LTQKGNLHIARSGRVVGHTEVSGDAFLFRDSFSTGRWFYFPRLQYWHAAGSLSGTRGSQNLCNLL